MPRGGRAKERMNVTCRVGTYNIHGKLETDIYQQEQVLAQEMKRLKLQVCSLQETKMKEDCEIKTKDNGYIINRAGKSTNQAQNWGMGFYISEEWSKYKRKVQYINDRILVLSIKMYKTKELVIINGYAPTSKEINREKMKDP
jgi:exonuclease III